MDSSIVYGVIVGFALVGIITMSWQIIVFGIIVTLVAFAIAMASL